MRRRGIQRTAAQGLCGLVLIALHVIGGYLVLNALLTRSEGPWDTGVTDTVQLWSALGLLTEAFAAAVTAASVAVAGLRKWWYVIPALLALTAAARFVFAPEA